MIELTGINKSYRRGPTRVSVLNNISLRIGRGEFVAIMGPSGSGKSTLLNIIGCLDVPDTGKYVFGKVFISIATERQIAGIRNRQIGFVFQSFNLIPRIDAQRNVELPMIYAGIPAHLREQRALASLNIVGLKDRAHHSPMQLSGGQQQRVAIARAIVNDPQLIIADEPTGALDSQTSHEIMQLFSRLNESGKTIVMVTHESDVARYAKRVVQVRDGKIYDMSSSH